MDVIVPNVLREFLARWVGNPCDWIDDHGRCYLPYDGGRLDILVLARHSLLIEAAIVDLDVEPARRAEQILKALRFAAGAVPEVSVSLAIRMDEDDLVLQKLVDTSTPIEELESQMDVLLDHVYAWRAYIDTDPRRVYDAT